MVRPLAPGRYTVIVEAPDHAPATVAASVPAGGQGLSLDLELLSLRPPAADGSGEAPAAVTQKGGSEKGASGGSVTLVEVASSGGGGLTSLQVMAYVLGVPLVGGAAFLLWRQSREAAGGGRRVVEPWYAMMRLPTGGYRVAAVASV